MVQGHFEIFQLELDITVTGVTYFINMARIHQHFSLLGRKITYNDTGSRAPATTDAADAADALSTSEDLLSPAVGQLQSISLQHCQQQEQQQGMILFGFDNTLQMELAATELLEQQMQQE